MRRKEPVNYENLPPPEVILRQIVENEKEIQKHLLELQGMLTEFKQPYTMNFFQQLAQISPDADITIRIMGKNGKYTVGVTPAVRESKIVMINTTGTPQELDEGLMNMLKAPLQQAGLVIKNLTEYQNSLKSAEKDSKAEMDKAVKKGSSGSKEAKPTGTKEKPDSKQQAKEPVQPEKTEKQVEVVPEVKKEEKQGGVMEMFS